MSQSLAAAVFVSLFLPCQLFPPGGIMSYLEVYSNSFMNIPPGFDQQGPRFCHFFWGAFCGGSEEEGGPLPGTRTGEYLRMPRGAFGVIPPSILRRYRMHLFYIRCFFEPNSFGCKPDGPVFFVPFFCFGRAGPIFKDIWGILS